MTQTPSPAGARSAHCAPSNQEAALLDYVERLSKHRSGRRAIRVCLSNLRPYNRREHHLRIAGDTLEPLVQKFEGALFRLFNSDIVLLCKGAAVADIDDAVLRLRYLFSEDPLLKADEDGRAPFCDWFDLEENYEAVLALAIEMVEARATQEAEAARREAAEAAAAPLRPIAPSDLSALKSAIAQADLSGLIRRQAVCAVVRERKPEPVFYEVYTSIESLQDALLPEVDLRADPWLFRHLTQQLDRRVIAYLSHNDDATLSQAISVNLHVATLLSPDFLNFDEALSGLVRRAIVIELDPADVFCELGNFLFVRNFLHDRGYRFCLDAVTHLSLPLIDRARLGFDLVKIHWSPDLRDQLDGVQGEALRQAAQTIGQERLILARCDSELAFEAGHDLGISLYQGHMVDHLLARGQSLKDSISSLAEAMTRHRAATRKDRKWG